MILGQTTVQPFSKENGRLKRKACVCPLWLVERAQHLVAAWFVISRFGGTPATTSVGFLPCSASPARKRG